VGFSCLPPAILKNRSGGRNIALIYLSASFLPSATPLFFAAVEIEAQAMSVASVHRHD
jgi:hypothetical protein